MRIIIGITGASGSIYGYNLIKILKNYGVRMDIILSKAGEKVLELECGVRTEKLGEYGTVYDNNNLFADIASGSCKTDGMVIVPCSMNTIAMTSAGIGNTLLLRTAMVMLKERRRMIFVTREMPYDNIMLRNMEKISNDGGIVMSACPGFYLFPQSVEDLVNSVDYKIVDLLGMKIEEVYRWKDPQILRN